MVVCDDIVALKNSEGFLDIFDEKKHYYGGDQKWFKEEAFRRVGCSTVAAANITAYISLRDGDKKLYKFNDMKKDNFIKHMESLGKYIYPDEVLGTISSLYFMDRVIDFAEDRGVRVKSNWITTEYDFDKLKEFIKEALRKDSPVALLMLKNNVLKEFDWHWMTVTRLFENNDKTYLNVSTWGERKVITLEDFYIYSHYGTMTYFDVIIS
ncbi:MULTISPECIES: hypothetical protein [Clostridium]|uniref:Peptidase C39-like domain-containing protein n=1 Tax=Clostridium cibarium TaxID=2762247 RepID=A0ABR8PVD3_9CLOT|nr:MULTISPECIES: hypothetical protein [Clostridium]MBD7912123.1 hypothetical protein [Clostridium cibarium]